MTASPVSRRSGERLRTDERPMIEGRTIALLLAGATVQRIRDEVGISAPTILRIRREAGLPASGNGGGQEPRMIDQAIAASVEPYGDGHARWTGPMAGRMPQLCAEGQRFNARHVLFERHHGRPPTGYVRSSCSDKACIAGTHLTDDLIRDHSPEQPVTVKALRSLLGEIDREGGPQAARDNRLNLTPQELAMATAPESQPIAQTAMPAPPRRVGATAPADSVQVRRLSESLPIGQLLKWAADHEDPNVQATAEHTRAALVGLRARYDTDHELAVLANEEKQLEKRLAELRSRRDEIVPRQPRKKRATDPAASAARAWAKETGVDCPGTGRVPASVMTAWRAATGGTA